MVGDLVGWFALVGSLVVYCGLMCIVVCMFAELATGGGLFGC